MNAAQKKRISILLFIAFTCGCIIIYIFLSTKPQRHATFVRPDGKYAIVVYRFGRRLPMMPGQGSDSPGEIQLQDGNGRILRKTTVEMVQLVENVEWRESSVSIKLIADWPLP